MKIEKQLEKPIIRNGKILTNEMKFIILHHTGSTAWYKNIVKFLLRSDYLSVHYVVGRNGEIVQMLEDNWLGYHAGVSEWSVKENAVKTTRYNDLNKYSIGIEVNSNGYLFTQEQRIETFNLVKKLMKEHNIPASHVLTHAMIAPKRKWDIGINFFTRWRGYDNFLIKLEESIEEDKEKEKKGKEERLFKRVSGIASWGIRKGKHKKKWQNIYDTVNNTLKKYF